MKPDKIRQAIFALPAVSGLNSAVRSKIADVLLEIGVPQKIAANTTLFRSREASDDEGIVLIEGELEIEKEGNPGLTAYAPDLIGEMAQLNPTRQRTATVTAATELSVLRFTWPNFTRLARTKLTDEELEAFTAALQEHAWKHFTQ